MSGVCTVLGLICIGYFFLYVSLVDWTNKFTFFWMLLGILLFGVAGLIQLMDRKHLLLPEWLSRAGGAVLICGLAVFLLLEGVIIVNGQSRPAKGADYLIVLGARVKGSTPSYNLAKRLDVAAAYLKENPHTKVILSGGKGAGEDISEAEAMSVYLEEKGIARGRMFLENQSVNTDENIAFSQKFLPDTEVSVVLVSSAFHLYRAKRIARKQGLTQVTGLGSPSKWYTVPNSYVREGFAVIKYALCGQI